MHASARLDSLSSALATAQLALSQSPPASGGALAACRAVLASHGLAVVQALTWEGTALKVLTRLLHPSGQWLESVLEWPLWGALEDPAVRAQAPQSALRAGLALLVSPPTSPGRQAPAAPAEPAAPVEEAAPVGVRPQAAAPAPAAPQGPQPAAKRPSGRPTPVPRQANHQPVPVPAGRKAYVPLCKHWHPRFRRHAQALLPGATREQLAHFRHAVQRRFFGNPSLRTLSPARSREILDRLRRTSEEELQGHMRQVLDALHPTSSA